MRPSASTICRKCGQQKTRVEATSKGNTYYRCRPCWAAYMREFNQRPEQKEKVRARGRKYYKRNVQAWHEEGLRRRFGISLAQYKSLLELQGGVCAVCGGKQNTAGKENLSVDHCHATGVVRGLLCNSCNMAIGMVKDDPARLRRMADYLDRARRAQVKAVA